MRVSPQHRGCLELARPDLALQLLRWQAHPDTAAGDGSTQQEVLQQVARMECVEMGPLAETLDGFCL